MPEQGQTLSSWKEIAGYLDRTVRTCQRLEMTMGLPIHRLDGSPKARVFAYSHELDAWLAKKMNERALHRRRRRLALLILGAVAVIGVASAVFLFVRGDRARVSVAVMPFTDRSPDKSLDHVVQGIADETIGALGQLRSIDVCGRISSFSLRGKNADARQIGRILGVRYLVEGSLEATGERLKITYWLVDARDGRKFAERPLDLTTRDVFAIRDEVSSSVVENLRVTVLPQEKVALGRRSTADSEAYELYLRGRYLLGQPKIGAPEGAIRFFEEALAKDPNFAPAYAGEAWAYAIMQMMFQRPPKTVFPQARSAVEKALALDPLLAEAHAIDAWVKFQYEWNWAAAERGFLRALELKPGDAMTHGMFAMLLLSRERFDESRREIKQAKKLEPFMPLLHNFSLWIQVSSGHAADCLEQAETFIRLEPDFEFAYVGAGLADLRLGRVAEAEKMFEAAKRFPWNSGRVKAGLIACALKRGDRKTAEALYRSLLEDRKTILVSPVMLTWAAASLGNIDEALNWLDAAIDERDPHMPLVGVYTESFLPELRHDPRFVKRFDTVGLPR